jgi:hypothetical protein
VWKLPRSADTSARYFLQTVDDCLTDAAACPESTYCHAAVAGDADSEWERPFDVCFPFGARAEATRFNFGGISFGGDYPNLAAGEYALQGAHDDYQFEPQRGRVSPGVLTLVFLNGVAE